jgi:hypothetical protein
MGSKYKMKNINLSNLESSSEQEVFNFIVSHLMHQKCKSINVKRKLERGPYDGQFCSYRYVDAMGKILMCAAGCLISEEEYSETFEDETWSSLADRGLVPKHHLNLIFRLQLVHDNSSVINWPDRLRTIAEEFDLSPILIPTNESWIEILKVDSSK